MSTNFTPGPWTIKHATNVFGKRLDTGVYGSVCTTGGHQSNQVDCTAENEANAKLIAALPDLLAALQRVVECDSLDYEETVEFGGYYLDVDIRVLCDKAIAKAIY